jgi:hypothetical protein
MSGGGQARTAARVVARRDDEIVRLITGVLQAYEPPRMRCWPCFARRCAWNTQHAAEWTRAQADARDTAGIPDEQPVPFDLAVAQLPEPLRPDLANPTGAGTDRMPAAFAATMTIAGTGYCDTDGEITAAKVHAQEEQRRQSTAAQTARNLNAAPGQHPAADSVAAGASTSSVPAATSRR